MRRRIGIAIILFLLAADASALQISEIMSNPVGDDSGREWVEVYNETDSPVDLSTLMLSIKGGAPIATVSIQGGTTLPPKGYAIISSIVSASSPVSRFLDAGTGYPNYSGVLLRVASSASFVNTGTTSLDIRVNGVTADSISYTPAGEGKTLSRIGNSFVSGTPTPGEENQATESQTSSDASSNGSQKVVAQTAPPSPDIILLLPSEKFVVAGAETQFSVFGMTKSGQSLSDMSATWSFGDGGQAVGTTTYYAYAYPGNYIARVDAGNASVRGAGTMLVKVVTPELFIKGFGSGKRGAYVDLENPNDYDLDLSQWKLWIGFSSYVFPNNTVVGKYSITRIAGRAMGFEKHEFGKEEAIKITFPNLEEVARYVPVVTEPEKPKTLARLSKQPEPIPLVAKSAVAAPVAKISATATLAMSQKPSRDTRLVSWLRSFFAR